MPIETQPVAAKANIESSSGSSLLPGVVPNWLYNARLLWEERGLLIRITAVAFVVSLIITLVIPKTYESKARIMPPEATGSSSALFAALAGKAFGSDALGGLAASLIGGRNSGALFMDLLQSDSVTSSLVDRFELQKVYHKRYRVDAAKALVRRTTIVQDKKSGVLTLSVKDTNPARARDMVQAYLDGLNLIVNRTGSSSAHQERVFIEKRLQQVRNDLEHAQEAMSEFSSTHSAIDLKEQAVATVTSEARVQGEMIAAQSELQSLEQIYGDSNVRVRAAEARIASLNSELGKMGGSSAPLTVSPSSDDAAARPAATSYLPLRQVPRLAVPYANLFREVRVQETVYDLLTQQYEIARIQEAKDIPAINIIDSPGIPEKKSFPPRAILTIAFTLVALVMASFGLIFRHQWGLMDFNDPRRSLGREIFGTVATRCRAIWPQNAVTP